MRMITASALLWISGAVIGAALAPRGKRGWGAGLGAILVGAIGDKMLERRDVIHNAITN